MIKIPKRLRTIENAKDFERAWDHFKKFMQLNNFKQEEIQSVIHLVNSFYFMGDDVENYFCWSGEKNITPDEINFLIKCEDCDGDNHQTRDDVGTIRG